MPTDVPGDVVTSTDTSPDAIAQCQAAGALDPSFANGGVTGALFGDGYVRAAVGQVLIDSNARILLGGSVQLRDGFEQFAIARLLPDGSFDTSFGGSGKAIAGLANEHCYLTGIGLQSDGKIVGVGGCNGVDARFVLVRFLTNGAIDTTFGTAGLVVGQPGIRGYAEAVAIDVNDRIVVAGQSWSADETQTSFVTARYLQEGGLDPSFGVAGVALAAFENGKDLAFDLALQSDGRIIVVGHAGNGVNFAAFGAARYDENGALDSTFGTMGLATIGFGDAAGANSVGADSSGRLVIVGNIATPAAGLARLTSNGQSDPTFGTGGSVSSAAGTSTAIAISQQDEILAIGTSRAMNGSTRMTLGRFDGIGALDSTFGTGGLTHVSSISPATYAEDLAIQPDSRIVVAGSRVDASLVPSRMDFVAARVCP